jgi:putative phosphoribosyl transferase
MVPPLFSDRHAAGRSLASHLERLKAPLVLAIPRGGAPVGFELAAAIGAPLDVLVTRPLQGSDRRVVGAVAETGSVYLSPGVKPETLGDALVQEALAAEREGRMYREGRRRFSVEGRTVVLVDDGVVSGATARAAISAVRALRPRQLVLAVPIITRSVADALCASLDALVAVHFVRELGPLAGWYEDFDPVSSGEALALLGAARREPSELHPVVP